MSTETKKVALITGANRGLGLETARQLGRQGITVLVGARDWKKAHDAEATLKAEGIDAHAIKLDVTSTADHKDRGPGHREAVRQAGYSGEQRGHRRARRLWNEHYGND
jgi:NAD(P)-dependent dehydrogenase (short-subunit alcohol dehydrogenase family)